MARDGWSVEVGLRKGRDAPDWWLDEPQLGPLDVWVISAFWTLSSCRQVGMGYGQIPWTAIHAFAKDRKLSFDNRLIFEHLIREMDSEYLAWHSNEQDKRRKAAADQKKSP